MVLLPLLAGWLLYRLFRHAYGPLDACRRGAVVWGVTMLAMTELLSAVHALGPAGASVGWALLCALLAALLWQRRGDRVVPTEDALPTWPLVTPVALTLVTTLLIGLVAAPNS